MGYKNEYLPTKCWFKKDGSLHRAYFEYEEACFGSPRDWDNLGVIVNASSYCLTGYNDEKVNDIEEWLIAKTGINEDWYWNNKKREGGIDGLIQKFRKQCVAFEYLTVYDHSGITVSCGYCTGWDYSPVGFIYVPKDSEEVKSYRKGHTLEETEEWASKILHGEIQILDDYVRGNVYCAIHEVYDEETDGWEMEDTLGGVYLTADTKAEEEKYALEYIEEWSGKAELLDMKDVEKAIEDNVLDVLKGQKTFAFMEIA